MNTWRNDALYARVLLGQLRHLTRNKKHRNFRFVLIQWAANARLRTLESIRGRKKHIVEQVDLF